MNLGSFGNKLLIDYFRWTAAAVVVAILGLGYVFLIQARITELRTSGYLERTKVESDLAARRTELQQLQASIAKFERVLPKEKLDIINNFLPTGTDFPRLVLMINDIAQAANLDLQAVAVGLVGQTEAAAVPGATSAAGAVAQAAALPGVNVQAQDVTISVTQGQSYETFKRFIGLLESSQRLFDIVSLSFDHPAGDATAGEVNATYSLTIRTYFLPQSL